MTIVIGMLARNGVVVAADSQETHAGLLKVFQGKISAVVNESEGKAASSLVVAGAGSAGHVDGLVFELCDGFSREPPDSLRTTAERIRASLVEFHQAHVLPFSALPDYDRPSCALIVAAAVAGKQRLWLTEKSVVVEQRFSAVGIGAAHAKMLMERLWEPGLALRDTQTLAAYVLFHVKKSVEGCGYATQMLSTEGNQPFIIQPEKLERLEEQFSELLAVENRLLRCALGLHGPRKVRVAANIVSRVQRCTVRIDKIASSVPRVSRDNFKKVPLRWYHSDD
jgi:hypothetical protein